jgi:integrase
MKLELTDSVVKSLIPEDRKYTVWDTAQDPTGLGLRVRPSGIKTFVLLARPHNSHGQVMVTLGRAGTLRLSTARKKAWDALQQMNKGVNPNDEKRKLQIETFGALAEVYMAEELCTKRQGHQVARYLRADWLGQVPVRTRVWKGTGPTARQVWKTEWTPGKDPIFTNKPAALITREDILNRLNIIRRTRGAYAARHALDAVRRTFLYAFNHGHSGIKVSPAASLHDRNVGLTGDMLTRQRVLSTDEIYKVWDAASDLGMFGVLVKLLLITAQRRDDWAEARWSEISTEPALLTVPAARYKSNQTHEVPLTPLAKSLLDSLPRFKGSDWIFTVDGSRPITSIARHKETLDKISGVTGWKLHDLRRTGRTLMANLEVEDGTAERVLGHSFGGRLMKTYNVSRHRPQKTAALTALQDEILRITK